MPKYGAWVLLAGLAVGCGGDPGPSVPETPPPATKPPAPGAVAYRPTVTFGGRTASAGTAFVLKAPSGKRVALTAAHILDPGEWDSLTTTTLTPLLSGTAITVSGRPAYVGKSFDERTPVVGGFAPRFDTSEDFAIWTLPAGAEATPLELAAEDPKVNEWVWVVGQEPGKAMQFYRAKVTRSKQGTVEIRQHDRFNPHGFSGGPVLSADGKVVGTTLAGANGTGQGAATSNIRRRLAGL
jgi:V8-like Glu-specific endopeptidase